MRHFTYAALLATLTLSVAAHGYSRSDSLRKQGGRSDERERGEREQSNLKEKIRECMESGRSETDCIEIMLGQRAGEKRQETVLLLDNAAGTQGAR